MLARGWKDRKRRNGETEKGDWTSEDGRFITLPMVFTKDPDTGRQNCGMYRIHIYDKRQQACTGISIRAVQGIMISIRQ